MSAKEKILLWLGIEQRKQIQEKQEETLRNIAETKRLLTLDGEDQWMLNLCRTPKNGTKECLPNDDNK